MYPMYCFLIVQYVGNIKNYLQCLQVAVEEIKGKMLQDRTDLGWQHGIEVDNNFKKVQCKYCGIIRFGGVFRLKHHLAHTRQNVEPCTKVQEDVKKQMKSFLEYHIEEAVRKKKKIYEIEEDYSVNYVDEVNKNMKRKRKIDSYVHMKKENVQATLNHMYKKEEREEVCQQIARFLHTSAIPFNVVNNSEFSLMLEKIGKYEYGLKPPSYHEIRAKFLKKEVDSTFEMFEEYKVEWRKIGCTIMSDGWSNRKRRSICNFMVNSPKDTVF